MDNMNFNSFICKSSITVNLKRGQSPLIKQIHVTGFKAMANQYITHLYARIIYALHNNHGNCNAVYLYGDTFNTSPGHLMSFVLQRDAAGTGNERLLKNYPARKPDKRVHNEVAAGRRNQGGCYSTQRAGTPHYTRKKGKGYIMCHRALGIVIKKSFHH